MYRLTAQESTAARLGDEFVISTIIDQREIGKKVKRLHGEVSARGVGQGQV